MRLTEPRPWWRPRWYELLPEIGLAIGLTIFLVDETDAATSAFKSGRALTLMAIVALGWGMARFLLARLTRRPVIRTGIFAAAALGVLAVVVLPAYDDDTVIETYPRAAAPAADAAPTTSAPPTTLAPAAAPSATATTAIPETTAPTTTAPSDPIPFRVGSFRGVDHSATGTVAFYRESDGRFVIGLEEFDIQPGPDYDLYVVPGDGREDRDGGSRVDDLRGNRGTQFYDAPSDVDLARGTWTVLVWCETFAVPVATATPV